MKIIQKTGVRQTSFFHLIGYRRQNMAVIAISNLDAQDLRKTSLFAVLFEFDAVRKVGCNCQTSGEEIYLHLCLAVNINLEYF